MYGRSMFGGFENDPFFAEFREQQRQMSAVFNDFGFPSLFPPSPFNAISDGTVMGAPHMRRQPVHPTLGGAMVAQPYTMFDNSFLNMNSMMMMNMQPNFQMAPNPHTHTFSQSSVTSFSNNGEVYHASSSTRTAPGGIKETRKAVRDSESGVEKMSIGHHIYERGHVIGKSRNRRTGEEEENQEFHNIEEGDARTFDQEWKEKTSNYHSSSSRQSAIRSRPYDRHDRLAITSGREYKHHHRERSPPGYEEPRKKPRKDYNPSKEESDKEDSSKED
ncbi:myeloid leukemia factor 1-like isoform X2 [Glandiceps talaboti]